MWVQVNSFSCIKFCPLDQNHTLFPTSSIPPPRNFKPFFHILTDSRYEEYWKLDNSILLWDICLKPLGRPVSPGKQVFYPVPGVCYLSAIVSCVVSHWLLSPCWEELLSAWVGPDIYINSLWPSDAIWQHRTGSTFSQVMVCCLTTTNHCLKYCWLNISEVFWQFPWEQFYKKCWWT